MYKLLIFMFSCVLSFHIHGEQKKISMNNTILATIRDQVLTVVDVRNKLDMLFYQQFPQFRESTEAKYEFYKGNWKRILEDLVDRQLILLLAEDKNFQVSNGDLRQEMEELFGPNVMMNLYQAGLSIGEVQEMLRADILMRRVVGFYVQMPIFHSLTPEVLRKEYERYLESMKKERVWTWKSVTIRAKDGECSKETAEAVWEVLTKKENALPELQQLEGLEVALSQPFCSKSVELAPQIYKIFSNLSIGVYSRPIEYVGRSSKSWKIYILDNVEQQEVPSFSEVENLLREQLAGPQIAEKTRLFFNNLRKEYHAQELISQEQLIAMEPFELYTKSG